MEKQQNIQYFFNKKFFTKDIIDLYRSAKLNRPIEDFERIEKMYLNSNLVVSAWLDDKLIGIARTMTDYSYASYLSDLAVDSNYQNQGIGKELIEKTKTAIGKESMLLLLASPSANDYYPKVGFKHVENGYIFNKEI